MTGDGGLLKLKALDDEDLQVISGALQDAIVPVLDIAYDAHQGLFMFAANRFRWEAAPHSEARGGARIRCAVTFANVTGVRRKGIDRRQPGAFLNLLAIGLDEPSDAAEPAVLLTFSGGAAIRLETSGLLCHLEDFGEPWPVPRRPRHAND